MCYFITLAKVNMDHARGGNDGILPPTVTELMLYY